MPRMLHKIKAIDAIDVVALMDNVSDPFTQSHDGMRWNESQYREAILKKEDFCGADFCRACNGLSLFIRIHYANKTHAILFDTGPDDGLVVENAKRLSIDLTEVEAIILSHGHFDHYGGILSVLDAIGKKDLPVYTHPELFLPRAFGKDALIKVSYNLTNQDIAQHGGKVIESKQALSLFEDTVLISGEVPRKTRYELGSPAECRQQSGEWVKSPEVIDERSLIFNIKDKGLCVFTACGHTGVINATHDAMQLTDINNVYLIMGGFHLAPPEIDNRVQPTINDLAEISPTYIVTGHCTGAKTQARLSLQFPNQHIPYAVGTVFRF